MDESGSIVSVVPLIRVVYARVLPDILWCASGQQHYSSLQFITFDPTRIDCLRRKPHSKYERT